MTQHDITYRYARKAGFGDALGTLDDLEERQRRHLAGKDRLTFRRQLPQAPESAVHAARASSLILGPDGKPLA